MKKPSERAQQSIKKLILIVMVIYFVFVVGFYFLAGDQLRLRQSRGNIPMSNAEAATVELVQGSVVEQTIVLEIQQLQSVSVQWGAYYRTNAGTATIQLINPANEEELMRGSFDISTMVENQSLQIQADQPIETIYGAPLILRMTADSVPGSGITPLITTSQPTEKGFSLRVNGQESAGTICFSAMGEDCIWIGLHYWELTAALGAVLLAYMLWEAMRFRSGRRSYVIHAVIAIGRYKFLIRQLVGRDFKTKYKRSILGVFWSFLNPLLMMCVQYVVFSTIFKADIPNYPVYLIIGIVSFNFFSEACGMSLTSILGNASLITKVYMPKYIYPMTRVMSSVVNFGISLIPLLLVAVFTGVSFHKSALLAIFFWCCLILFSLGLGMLLSTAMVFFRDIQFLWNIFNMIWMYATPIFYPESILPETFRVFLQVNPLYHFLKSARMCILDGISPEPMVYVQCALIALAMLIVGAVVFYRSQDKFVLYL